MVKFHTDKKKSTFFVHFYLPVLQHPAKQFEHDWDSGSLALVFKARSMVRFSVQWNVTLIKYEHELRQ